MIQNGMVLPPKEYGELCHAIWTINAGKIPELGFLLYKNHFYIYNYDVEKFVIVFEQKVEIDGNEELIATIIGSIKRKWSN